jgi:hypothetical protein
MLAAGLLVATAALRSGPGLFSFPRPLSVTDPAFLHYLFGRQLTVGNKLPDAALGLRKFVVTEIAIPKSILVCAMVKSYIAGLFSLQHDIFGSLVLFGSQGKYTDKQPR